MIRTLSATLSAVLQVLVFAAPPFLVYVFTRRTARGFLAYVGLVKPEKRSRRPAAVLVVAVVPLLLLVSYLPGLREAAIGPGTVTGRLRTMGPSLDTIYILLVGAWVQTSLSEELLFRGFIGRRLVVWWGFAWGNVLQAMLFGLVHVVLLTPAGSAALRPALVLPAFAISAAYGWALGYLKERAGNGSVLPCWWVHGLANTISWTVIALVGG